MTVCGLLLLIVPVGAHVEKDVEVCVVRSNKTMCTCAGASPCRFADSSSSDTCGQSGLLLNITLQSASSTTTSSSFKHISR